MNATQPPTPAPVAVPEGGWQDGDAVTLTSGHVVVRGDETGKWTEIGDHRVTQDVQRGRVVYVHAHRPEPVVRCERVDAEPGHEDEGDSCATHNMPWDECHRREPVVAPLLTEAVERLQSLWDDGNATGLDGYVGPGRGTEPIDPEAEQARDAAVAKALAALRLVPEDDEDTVRVPRGRLLGVARYLANDRGRSEPDSRDNRNARDILEVLDGPR